MKYVKMLGLAAIAAAGLMAFLGAGTASATVLCETTPTNSCGTAWHVNASTTTLKFSAEDSVALTGPFGITIATCTTSLVEGTPSTGGASETVSGSITKLTFENCNRPVTVNTSTTGSLEVHHIAGTDNGTVTSSDTTVTIHEVPLGFGTCNYLTNNTDIGTLTGKDANSGITTFDISATISAENSCPSGTWEGHYVNTTSDGAGGTTQFNVAAS